MIIYPSGFILSAAEAGRPITLPQIGWHTYTFDLDASDVVVSTESAAGPRDAPLRPDTASFWEPTALPATLKIDLGSLLTIDYVGLVGVIGSAGCAAKIETSTDNANFDLFSEEISAGADDPLMFLDDAVSCRWVRLTLTGSSVMPKVAVIYVGEVLGLPYGCAGGFSPINLSRQTELVATLSRGGQFLGQGFRRHGVAGNVTIRGLEEDFYIDEFDLFVQHARSRPYFFAWNPAEFPRQIVYGWTKQDIAPAYMDVNRFFEVSWPIVGVGHA